MYYEDVGLNMGDVGSEEESSEVEGVVVEVSFEVIVLYVSFELDFV